jgi:hypothetical protein
MLSKEVAEAVGGLKLITPTGTSVLVEGELSPTPEGTKQVCVCECVCVCVCVCLCVCQCMSVP